VVGTDRRPSRRTLPQLRRESPTFVIDDGARDQICVLAGEDRAEDRQVIVGGVVAVERPSPRRNLVQDRREGLAVTVDDLVKSVVVQQEAAAPAGPREDLAVDEDTLRGIEGVF
jgi:hypothetical protein